VGALSVKRRRQRDPDYPSGKACGVTATAAIRIVPANRKAADASETDHCQPTRCNQENCAGIWRAGFMQDDLGYSSWNRKPATRDNPFGTRLSPMS